VCESLDALENGSKELLQHLPLPKKSSPSSVAHHPRRGRRGGSRRATTRGRTRFGGIAATRATEAALTAYPGGIVDRAVKISSSDYEVHYIGVNWPHHIFVKTDYEVIGAD
jgi:hypothetical protein